MSFTGLDASFPRLRGAQGGKDVWPEQHTGPRAVHAPDRMLKSAQFFKSLNQTWVNVSAWGAPHIKEKLSFLSPRGKKRGQLRLADHTRLRRFALHFVPTREFQERPRRLTPVVRRIAPTGSTLVFMRDALSASQAGRAMSVTSDVMSPIERN